MQKFFNVFLENKLIGVTHLELADVPMGVLTGKISFIGIESGYDYFMEYFNQHPEIKLTLNDPEYKALSSVTFPDLKVKYTDGTELIGAGNLIEGIESEYFEVTILGYPNLEGEFPHHVEAYKNMFK